MKQRFRFSSHQRRSSREVSQVSGVSFNSRIRFSNSDPFDGGTGVGRPALKFRLPLGVINVSIILLGTVGRRDSSRKVSTKNATTGGYTAPRGQPTTSERTRPMRSSQFIIR